MKGIIPSLNTPFSKKGSLDHNSLAKLVEHTIKSGCNGMLGLAVAGEGESLSFEEKVDFMKLYKSTDLDGKSRAKLIDIEKKLRMIFKQVDEIDREVEDMARRKRIADNK